MSAARAKSESFAIIGDVGAGFMALLDTVMAVFCASDCASLSGLCIQAKA
jgi:hypothetical protein